MYKCNNCGETFYIPVKQSFESLYGVGDEFDYEYGYVEECPFCESEDIIERDEIENG